jgi:hypothetical protein
MKSVKHSAAKSVNRSILKKIRHIEFGVFIVHSSMGKGNRKTKRGRRRRLHKRD